MEQEGRAGFVTYHREGRLGFITLNRPHKRNALNPEVWEALDRAIARAEEDGEARVVLLRGEGESFCSGLDLSPENELIKYLRGSPSALQKVGFFQMVRRAQAIHNRLERLVQPTLAVIHGHCLGAGLELVLCCDVRLCSQDTQFALPEARLAIITDVGGLQRLPRVVGPGAAREIAYRGHRFGAAYAERIGLVNHVYEDHSALSAGALDMAREIAENPPLAVQGAKEVFLFEEGGDQDRSLAYNAARSAMVVPSEDLFEALAAYTEKRKGEFRGA